MDIIKIEKHIRDTDDISFYDYERWELCDMVTKQRDYIIYLLRMVRELGGMDEV